MSSALPQAIRMARVPARLAGEPRLRQGLERWLAEADPARHGLPADAIVLVRRLSARWSTVQAGDAATRYAPLDRLVAGARRGAAAGADADAVWFADEAELLACLARDALAGLLERHWWWRSFTAQPRPGWPTAAPPELRHWLLAPQQMPRALQSLGPVRAQAWLTGLGAHGLRRMIAALMQAWPLADETEAWVLEGTLPLQQAGSGASPGLPRETWPTASAAAHRLLRLCAALRSDATAVAGVAALFRLAEQVARESPDIEPPRQPEPINPTGPATTQASTSATRPPPEGSAPHTHSAPLQPGHPAAAARRHGGPPRLSAWRADTHTGAPPAPAAAHAAHALDGGARLSPDAPADGAMAWSRPLDTRHGGLLFLLNAALALGWYGDFTQPRHRGLACSPWRLLLLAGQAWAGPGWRRDPLRRRLIERSAGSHEALPLALWPLLHARLAEALGDELPPRTQLRRMLALPARLHEHGERLDVCFALARLPLAVRLAGLDRDPGWIPAAGCDIRFHFD